MKGVHRIDRRPRWLHVLRLHDWDEIGGFIAEGGTFSRQQCRICGKTRAQRVFS
jgi:hypothetical protein